MKRKAYTTDLNDNEWRLLEPYMPKPKLTGRPREHSLREILNAIFYITKSGCVWRLLPNDFPKWQSVYYYFRLWKLDGTWKRIHDALRTQVRERADRNPQPSAGVIDSQSVKTTSVGGSRGYDPAKKINGRKRHLLVDTQGLVLGAKVHPGNISDRKGAELLLPPLKSQLPKLEHIWADSAYSGKVSEWIQSTLGWSIEVVKHWWTGVRGFWVAPGQEPPEIPSGFHVLPRRWVVERTFAWLGFSRRLSKDYERLTDTSETFIYVAMSRLMVRRLVRN